MTKFASDNIECFKKIIQKYMDIYHWSDDWIINDIKDYINCNNKKVFKVEIYYAKDLNYTVGYRYFASKTITLEELNILLRRDKLKRLKIC